MGKMLQLCSDLALEVLDAVIPNRTKRLIVLSSLCPVVSSEEEITDEYLTMLNTQLSLCREKEALKLPIAISHSIWDNLPEEAKACSEDCDCLAGRIMAKLPDWLKYDRDTVIMGELQDFLRFNTVFHTSHTTNIHPSH